MITRQITRPSCRLSIIQIFVLPIFDGRIVVYYGDTSEGELWFDLRIGPHPRRQQASHPDIGW